jgi:hypothetical protein
VKEPPKPASQPILEDIGIVGTEGRGVEILDVPSRSEQLSELVEPVKIEPVKKSKSAKSAKSREVEISPFSPLKSFQFSDVYPEQNPLFVEPFGRANILTSNVKEDLPLSATVSLKKTEELPLTAPLYAQTEEPPAAAPKKARKPPRTQAQVREDLELEYQTLTGLPVKPAITNKELKALIFAEKRRNQTKKGIGRIMGREV